MGAAYLEAVLCKPVGQKLHAVAIGKTRSSSDRCPADLSVNQEDTKISIQMSTDDEGADGRSITRSPVTMTSTLWFEYSPADLLT